MWGGEGEGEGEGEVGNKGEIPGRSRTEGLCSMKPQSLQQVTEGRGAEGKGLRT